jgi:F-box and WD-40 domain protein CDC4
VASGGVDTAVRVWDARTGACVARLQVHTALVCQLQLTPSLLVSGGADGRVMVYALDGARIRVQSRLTAHDSSITALQLVCGGRLLVTSGNDGRARLWDVRAGGRYVREMSDGGDGVWGVVFRREAGAVFFKRTGKMFVEVWGFAGLAGEA